MGDSSDGYTCFFNKSVEVNYSEKHYNSYFFNVPYYKVTIFELQIRHLNSTLFLIVTQKGKFVFPSDIKFQANKQEYKLAMDNTGRFCFEVRFSLSKGFPIDVKLSFPEPKTKQLRWTSIPIELLNNGAFCDLLIKVKFKENEEIKCDENEEATFKVSKAILAARSQIFRKNFESGLKEAKTGVLKINDFSSKIIEIMLKFFYTCNLELDEEEKVEQAIELVRAAHRYDILLLKLLCEDILQDSITQETPVDVLLKYALISYLYECPALKMDCLKFMRMNLKKPSEDQTKMLADFSTKHPNTMVDLFVQSLNFKN